MGSSRGPDMLSADAKVRGEQATGLPQGGRSGGQGSLGAWLVPAQTGGMQPSQRLSRERQSPTQQLGGGSRLGPLEVGSLGPSTGSGPRKVVPEPKRDQPTRRMEGLPSLPSPNPEAASQGPWEPRHSGSPSARGSALPQPLSRPSGIANPTVGRAVLVDQPAPALPPGVTLWP